MTANAQRAVRTWFSVVRAYLACEQQYARLLGHFELTIAQYDALNVIERMGGAATPAELAQQLLVTRGNMTGLIRRLEARGLIRLTSNPADARSFSCSLTESANALIGQARLAAETFIVEQMAPFDQDTLASTEQLMNQMRAHLGELNPETIAQHVSAATTKRSTQQRKGGTR